MKKITVIIISLIAAIGIGFYFRRNIQKTADTVSDINTSTQPVAATSENEMTIEQVKKFMTNSEWSNAQSQWSRHLEIEACTENQCIVKSVFSAPDNCPENTTDDNWCDEVELIGKIQFIKNGFEFIEDKKQTAVFCKLSHGGFATQWVLDGPDCPTEFTQLLGQPK
ncbi:hypothetical protein CIK05_03805 [Bdellovibrio sp. qaytius]|nr:hypothetical protein CIK05_03805 [Bdellovibrio sp. qaytius]